MSRRKPQRNQNNKENFIRLCVSLVLFSLVSISVFAYSRYQRRMAEKAVWYEAESTEISANAADIEASEAAVSPDNSFQITDLSTYDYYRQPLKDWNEEGNGVVSYQGQRYRRNTYVKAILVMGVDRKDKLTEEAVTDYYGTGNADAMFLLVQDTAHNTVKILMLPRDAIVEMDLMDLEGNLQGTAIQNLTLAWSYGDGGKRSAENAIKSVSKMLCGLKIDYYTATNMAILGQINDAVDGVTVTIPNDELIKVDPEWTKGKTVTLHGGEAETFLRYRDITMDNAANFRMQQHREYMLGFYDAVRKKSRTDSNIITELYDLLQDHMITDMPKDRILKLGLDTINTGNLTEEDILSLPGIAKAADENWPWDRVFVDYSNAIPMILELFYREVN